MNAENNESDEGASGGPVGRAEFRELVERIAEAVAERLGKVTGQTLSAKEAMAYLGMSKSAFGRARAAGLLPKPVTVPGAGPRYRRKDLDTWLERLKPPRRKNSSSE